MSRRPRLVHEGLPIINSDEHVHSGDINASSRNGTSLGTKNDYGAPQTTQSIRSLASIASAAKNTSTTSKKKPHYKLQTRLVVGEDSHNNDEMEMMDADEDEHNHSHNSHQQHYDDSTSKYYGSQDNVNYGNHNMQQQHRSYQTQQQNGQPSNMYNNDYNSSATTEPLVDPNPPIPIYQMPSPSTSPLVVLDGANIAYNYAESLHPVLSSHRKREPDPKGISIAIEYFLKQSCRVQAVVPISWYQLKPRPADTYHLHNRSRGDSDAKMITDEVEELRNLLHRGFLVPCPPGDDDDAYVLALARREEDRRLLEEKNSMPLVDDLMNMDDDEEHVSSHDDNLISPEQLPKSVLGGYVVSNDMFIDAIKRDQRKQKHHTHHHHPLNARPISLRSWLKKNRISFTFANVGSAIDGQITLDFIPNPRNELIEAIDACNRLNCKMG